MLNKAGKRQLRALEIAKILFEAEGYHTRYLQEIEQVIKENKGAKYGNESVAYSREQI